MIQRWILSEKLLLHCASSCKEQGSTGEIAGFHTSEFKSDSFPQYILLTFRTDAVCIPAFLKWALEI